MTVMQKKRRQQRGSTQQCGESYNKVKPTSTFKDGRKVTKPRQNANVNQEILRLELKYLNLKIG